MPGTFHNNAWSRSWSWRSLVNGHFSALWDHSFGTVWWYCAVGDDCMQTLCLSPVPFQGGSSKRRLPSVSTLFCDELSWASWGHHKILLQLRHPIGLVVWRIQYACFHDLLALLRSVLHRTWIRDRMNTFQLSGMQSWPITTVSSWVTSNGSIVLESGFCCFHSRCDWSNLCQHDLHCFGT